MAIDIAKTYMATVKTDAGTFIISLDAAHTPLTVNNFVFLALNHFYNCVTFHRVVPNFMDQAGDPTGTGTGGPGYKFSDELPKSASPQYPVGSVAMANSGPNTNGSQFFIVTGPEAATLAPSYSLFGKITSGLAVVQKINADGNADPASNGVPPKVIHRILSVTISSS
jgi:cyclophilin family peptidyl-prolyl cis-trans isomerase